MRKDGVQTIKEMVTAVGAIYVEVRVSKHALKSLGRTIDAKVGDGVVFHQLPNLFLVGISFFTMCTPCILCALE